MEQITFFPFYSKSNLKTVKVLGQEIICSDLHFKNIMSTTHWIVDKNYPQDAIKHLNHAANCSFSDSMLTTLFCLQFGFLEFEKGP